MHTIAHFGAHHLRRHVRQVWQSRGGGFYGFVATLTFLYLEATNLLGDVSGLPGLRLNLGGVLGWLVQNLVAGVMNVVWSAIWPVKWIGLFGLGLKSGMLLVGAYLLFLLIRPLVVRLLSEPEEGVPDGGGR